ncbi:MAG: TauD/TfdA family dioxygenase [Rhizomicrobium sp.]
MRGCPSLAARPVGTRRGARFRARLPGARHGGGTGGAPRARQGGPRSIPPSSIPPCAPIRRPAPTGCSSITALTDRIKGLRREESNALLNMLFVHIQKPEYQERWKWKPNSIAFWDNRVTQHYAVNDYLAAPPHHEPRHHPGRPPVQPARRQRARRSRRSSLHVSGA